MKKQRKMLMTALISSAVLSVTVLAGALTTWAGEWTHQSPPSEFFGSSYDEALWYYIKDDGTYAVSEWVYDEGDKEWYWVDDTGSIPMTAGTPYKFITQEDYDKVQEGMTYRQVVEILGAYHEYSASEKTGTGEDEVLVETLAWYSEKAKGVIYVTFRNDIVAMKFSLLDLNLDLGEGQ